MPTPICATIIITGPPVLSVELAPYLRNRVVGVCAKKNPTVFGTFFRAECIGIEHDRVS